VVHNYIILHEKDPLAIFLGYAVRDFTPGEALERISREVIVTRFSRLLYTLRDQNTRVAETSSGDASQKDASNQSTRHAMAS